MNAVPLLDLFAVTAPGLEPVCAAELAAIGINAPVAGDGGVSWRGDLRSLYRANIECRTTSRVVARAGSFRARTFAELERHAARLPWTAFLAPGCAVALRVTCRKSKLYHEGAVAARIAGVLAAAHGVRVEACPADEAPGAAADAQLIIVRFMRDVCTISIDASGALLHQRGYRQAVARAPLRETLAAAMLLSSGWRGDSPLLDPMCGSGTIPIEAALLARRIPPGLANPELKPRACAFQRWPGFDAGVLNDVVAAARDRVLPSAGVGIAGSDRDAGAIAASSENAARAGVAADLVLTQAAVSALEPPTGTGYLVTNAPYGVRIGERRALHPLYAALGRVARERLPGWTVVMLVAEPRLAGATGFRFDELLATRNGGIAVRLLRAHVSTHSGEDP
ncbi:MAG: class I SAM-dependent RNA methyltransferase [Gemmatimonadota bacterium]